MIDLSERYRKTSESLRLAMDRESANLARKAGASSVRLASGDALGSWCIRAPEGDIARFAILYLPNCGAVAVLCDCLVEPQYRRNGIASALHDIRIAAARDAGATVALCTVLIGNRPMRAILRAHHWKVAIGPFYNPATDSWICLYWLNLATEKPTEASWRAWLARIKSWFNPQPDKWGGALP
jgi:GNAT superfamily N-acetyltransferase